MTLEELHRLYGHVQGQLSAAVVALATIAAQHKDRRLLLTVLSAAMKDAEAQEDGSPEKEAFTQGIAYTISVLTAAMKGLEGDDSEKGAH